MNEGAVLVVFEITAILNAELFKLYQVQARAQSTERGGSVLGRGSLPVEGNPPFGTLLVQKWPSERAFREWQDSEAYRPLKDLRRQSAEVRIAVVPAV